MIMKPTNETKTKGHYGDYAYVEEIIEKAGRWIDTRYRQMQKYAAAKSAGDGGHPKLARVLKLLVARPLYLP